MLPKHNEILRLDINLTLTAMKVPRLGLQVNYTQDSSRHNDNAETLEPKIILYQFLYSTINTNPTNKPELLSRCPNITRHSG